MKKSKSKPYAILAGVCYAICGFCDIINYIAHRWDVYITAERIILWIVMIGMAVALFLKNEKAVVAVAVANALHILYDLAGYFNIWNLFAFIAYALIVVLILLNLKKNAVVQKIWFVPGAALLLGKLVYFIPLIGHGIFSKLGYTWNSILFNLVEIGGLILIGLWTKDHDFVLSEDEPTNEYSKLDPRAVYSAPMSDTVIGSADKLKMYSELLESGTITQEEFDVKKKQILGL